MKVTVLVENTTSSSQLKTEHGLSLFIETNHHNILFDAGDSNLFEANAKTLGIDLSTVDIFILSHGHHDHGGGLNRFIEINQKAIIYAHQKAFDPHFSKRGDRYVNISVPFPSHIANRLILNQGELKIADELLLFSKINEQLYYPSSNNNLYMDEDNRCALDDFKHEQNLIISENNRVVLIAGCAHHGMLNIINEAQRLINKPIDFALGGLHLFSRSTGITESIDTIKSLGKDLLKTKVKLLTCHCTGDTAYEILKPIMKDNITYLRTGSVEIL